MPERKPCPLCGAMATHILGPHLRMFIECGVCGRYDIDFMRLKITENGAPIEDAYLLSAQIREQTELHAESRDETSIPLVNREGRIEPANPSLPTRIVEKAEKLLVAIVRRTKYYGQSVTLIFATDYPLAYARNHQELSHILDYLRDQELITRLDSSDESEVSLTPKGTAEVESGSHISGSDKGTIHTADEQTTNCASDRDPDSDFELLEERDSGLYGTVWLGRQISLDRQVAIKIIFPSMVNLSNALEHARALARLGHPNVVTVHQVAVVRNPDTAEVVDAVVMEWLDGQHLGHLLRRSRLELGKAIRICSGILDGVEHMHERGVAHGDLHAANVLVTETAVKIIDVQYSESQSLARLTSYSKEMRIQNDIDYVRHLVISVFLHANVNLIVVSKHENAIRNANSLNSVREAYKRITEELQTEGVPAVQQSHTPALAISLLGLKEEKTRWVVRVDPQNLVPFKSRWYVKVTGGESLTNQALLATEQFPEKGKPIITAQPARNMRDDIEFVTLRYDVRALHSADSMWAEIDYQLSDMSVLDTRQGQPGRV